MHFAGRINTGGFIIRTDSTRPKSATNLRLRNADGATRPRALADRVGLASEGVIVDVPTTEMVAVPARKILSHAILYKYPVYAAIVCVYRLPATLRSAHRSKDPRQDR
jgi:hypothetical protein